MQVKASEFHSVVFAHGAFGNQLCKGGRERGASGLRCEPETLFGAEGVVKGECVGTEHHFVGGGGEKLFQNAFELGRVKQLALEGSIQVRVFDSSEQGCFAFVGPAAVNEDEGCVLVARIAEHVFEIEDIALAEAEIIADAHGGMKVHGKLQFAGLHDHDAENVVLEEAVFVR